MTPAGSLTVSGSSSNTNLVPNDSVHLAFGGSGANRTLTITPKANRSGSATLTITVSDGQATATRSFKLTVNPVNDAPTLSSLTDQAVTAGDGTLTIPFTIGDVETAVDDLTLGASSSNTSLVPNGNLVLAGSGADRTLKVTPKPGVTGETIITVSVSDGKLTTSETFTLLVKPAGAPLYAVYVPLVIK